MDANWFWVAITRCTDLDKVNIITTKINGLKNYNLGAMINGYKKQDKEAGRDFIESEFIDVSDIEKLFVKQKARCALCDNVMNMQHKAKDYNNISVDRIDNDLPHLKCNCQLSCLGCNRAKK